MYIHIIPCKLGDPLPFPIGCPPPSIAGYASTASCAAATPSNPNYKQSKLCSHYVRGIYMYNYCMYNRVTNVAKLLMPGLYLLYKGGLH